MISLSLKVKIDVIFAYFLGFFVFSGICYFLRNLLIFIIFAISRAFGPSHQSPSQKLRTPIPSGLPYSGGEGRRGAVRGEKPAVRRGYAHLPHSNIMIYRAFHNKVLSIINKIILQYFVTFSCNIFQKCFELSNLTISKSYFFEKV